MGLFSRNALACCGFVQISAECDRWDTRDLPCPQKQKIAMEFGGWKAWSSTGGVSRAGVFRYAQDDPSTSTPNLNLSRKARAPFQFANNFRDRYGRLRLPFASSCHSTALLARDGHALDAQCGAGERAAPDEVAADLSEVA